MTGFGRDELTMGLLMIGFILVSYAFGYQRAVAEQPLVDGVSGISSLIFAGFLLIGVAFATAIHEMTIVSTKT